MADVLEGGGGDRREPARWRRGLRLAAAGAAVALLAWYAVEEGTGHHGAVDRAPGPVLPGPPAAPLAHTSAPVDAVVSVAEGGFPDGTVLARIGPGRQERVASLHGILLDMPNGVDPCAVPSDGAGGRGILHNLWQADTSLPAVRARDLSGEPRLVTPFLHLLGYRGERVWTAEGPAPGAPGSTVRVRYGIAGASRPYDSAADASPDEPVGLPVALLDSMDGQDQPGPVVTGVLYADGPDPTLPRADGYELRVEWPGQRGAAFHVERVLGFGADAVVAVDTPCDKGACGLTVLQANRGTAVVRQGVSLPEGWLVPDSPATGRLAFTDDGIVLAVGTRDGQHTALTHVNPYTGRAEIVPGSEGALLLGPKVVAASGPDVLFMVNTGKGGHAGIAYWDSATGERARMLTANPVQKSDRLVCAVPARNR